MFWIEFQFEGKSQLFFLFFYFPTHDWLINHLKRLGSWPGTSNQPGMVLTPFPSSIGLVSNPRPSDREPSTLPLDHSFRLWQPLNIYPQIFLTFKIKNLATSDCVKVWGKVAQAGLG